MSEDKEVVVKIEGGILRAIPSMDPNYPGITVEFIADDDTGQELSRPTVMFEKPEDDALRVIVWGDKNDEDYTDEITFK